MKNTNKSVNETNAPIANRRKQVSRNKMPLRKNYDYQHVDLIILFRAGENINELKSFLDKHGGINIIDEYGRTVLMNCIIDYNSPIKKISFANNYAKELINLGADINKKDKNNHTAIHSCILSKNYEMFYYLLELENIDIHFPPGLLMIAFENDKKNNSLVIKLMEHGLNPYEKEDGYSFYDLLKEYDDGIITVGGKNLDVKPLMDYILNNYKK